MDYPSVTSVSKPTTAPNQFTIFLVGEEEYIFCPIRNRSYKVNNKPEEKVRQWWLYHLKEAYGYDFEQMAVEVSVRVGSTEAKKKADIVVYQDSKKSRHRIFVEVKKAKRKDGVDQLEVYMNATGCRIGLWSNGDPPHIYLLRTDPKEGEEEATWRELRNIPAKSQQLGDVDTPILRRDLEPVEDFLSIIRQCENYIKAHEGSDPFNEIFKLIFAKLYDERTNLKNDDSPAQFRVGIFEAPEQVKVRITNLFRKARDKWAGVFTSGDEIVLSDELIAYCASALQKAYLLRSRADVLGAAFEVMVNPSMKGDMGQYFTPRHVIKMCIDILDPQEDETFFDPACGSGGFLVAAMEHVFQKIDAERDDQSEILEAKKDYGDDNVFGMDYDPLIAKVAKAYMLIWGDGRSNISTCDTLNEDNWNDETLGKFTVGRGKERKLRQFDIIATNPPFGGDIAIDGTLQRYDLAYKPIKNNQRKRVNKLSRDRLFIERCLTMLRPGGRLAIVLPRGILKNYTDEYIRRYILKHASIIAVVSLGGDMFKPFTNTKTCILFLKKRMIFIDNVESLENEPRITFSVTEKPGKNKSGQIILNSYKEIQSDLPEIAAFVKDRTTFE